MKTVKNHFTMPRLGNSIWRLNAPWKPTGFGHTQYGFILCLCNNDTRRHSKVLLWDGKNIRTLLDDTQGHSSNETIGNPFEYNGFVGLVGENGRVWLYQERIPLRPLFETGFATTATLLNGKPVVLDTRAKRLCVVDAVGACSTLFTMPGDGIAMAACQYDGKLYAAVADSETGNHGLSCSDGRLIQLPGCLCVVPFAGGLLYTTQNEIHALNVGCIARLACEKIMDMKVIGNHIYIAGANPDSLWIANARSEIALVGRVQHGNREVGGSCFRVRVAVNPHETKGYFAWTANGHQGEVYPIEWQ